MQPPNQIVQALKKVYQKPTIDVVGFSSSILQLPFDSFTKEWLEQCCTWIADEKCLSVNTHFQEFYKIVNDQLIASDLTDSMQRGTGLGDISKLSGKLPGPPVLVQITRITEIGTSAFQLEQVRAAREERMGVGIDSEEGEEDGDLEVQGEGPMPKYPRGTLHFELSDGTTVFEGMEYRPLPELVLGTSKLGFKVCHSTLSL